jgi:putative integral membrane protein (TIGR02587 family)
VSGRCRDPRPDGSAPRVTYMADEVAGRGEAAMMRSASQGYARGILGALLVSVPLLLTMEMWWLGFYLPPHRLLLFLTLNFGLLVLLEYYSGFQKGHVKVWEEVQDALDAYAIGLLVATVVLFLFGIVNAGMSLREVAGKIILEAIPLSIGASIAISVFGDHDARRERRKRRAGFWGSQLIGVAGATYFGFNVAPTEEPVVVALGLLWWHALLLILFGLLLTHAILYSVGFAGGYRLPGGTNWWRSLLESGVVSYVVALLVTAFLLWVFGRIDGDTGLEPALKMIVTLGFVNALGSAAAKLII